MKRLMKGSALLFGLMLVLAACGGDGDDGGDSAATTRSTAPSITVPDETKAGIGGDPLLSQRCLNYAGMVGAMGLGIAAAMDPNAAQELEKLRAKTDLADVPDEIRDDFGVILEYSEGLGRVMADYELKGGQLDPQAMTAIAAFSQTIDQERLEKASENVGAWMQAHCPG